MAKYRPDILYRESGITMFYQGRVWGILPTPQGFIVRRPFGEFLVPVTVFCDLVAWIDREILNICKAEKMFVAKMQNERRTFMNGKGGQSG